MQSLLYNFLQLCWVKLITGMENNIDARSFRVLPFLGAMRHPKLNLFPHPSRKIIGEKQVGNYVIKYLHLPEVTDFNL